MESQRAYICNSPGELIPVAEDIIHNFQDIRIILLKGNLGSGKTAFVKAFCSVLGVHQIVSSPTFTIVNEYSASEEIYHFDLYRMKSQDELFQIGFDEYLARTGYKLVEWPELALGLIDQRYIILHFEVTATLSRKITLESYS